MKAQSVHRSQAARDIVLCCRRLGQAGLIAGQDGNITVRYQPGRILVTPRGLPKADLATEDLVDVDLEGRHLAGSQKASTELDLHLRVYRAREDCGAVVHAHPPTATAFAVAGEGIPADVLPEVAVLLGEVPVVPSATTGTPALGDAIEPYLGGSEAVLLANHGAVAWGDTLATARIRMESLEHAARILLAARSLGRVIRLTPDQMHDLERLRGTLRHGQTDLGT